MKMRIVYKPDTDEYKLQERIWFLWNNLSRDKLQKYNVYSSYSSLKNAKEVLKRVLIQYEKDKLKTNQKKKYVPVVLDSKDMLDIYPSEFKELI